MANTWNKIKSKFRWKRGASSRSRPRRRSKNKASSPSHSHQASCGVAGVGGVSPVCSSPSKPGLLTTPKMMNNHSKPKKKPAAKSNLNLFGCFTNTPKDVEYNVQAPPPPSPSPPPHEEEERHEQEQREHKHHHHHRHHHSHHHETRLVRPISPTKSKSKTVALSSMLCIKDNTSLLLSESSPSGLIRPSSRMSTPRSRSSRHRERDREQPEREEPERELLMTPTPQSLSDAALYAYDPYDGVVEEEHQSQLPAPAPPQPPPQPPQPQEQTNEHGQTGVAAATMLYGGESIKHQTDVCAHTPSIVSAPLHGGGGDGDGEDDDDDDMHRVYGVRDRERDSVHAPGDHGEDVRQSTAPQKMAGGLDNAAIVEVNTRYQQQQPHNHHHHHHHHANTISMHELHDELQRSGYFHHSQVDQLEIAPNQPIFKIFQNFCPKTNDIVEEEEQQQEAEEEEEVASEDDDLKQLRHGGARGPSSLLLNKTMLQGAAQEECFSDKCSVKSAATTVSTKSSCQSYRYSHGSSKTGVVLGGVSRRTASILSEPQPEYYDGDVFRATYRVGERINEGGFGCVWKIDDNCLYAKCVKIMELGADEHSQRRRCKAIVREFAMTQKALSDEVVDVELFLDDVRRVAHHPRAYLVMPYFEGRDLFDYIDDEQYARTASTELIVNIFHNILEKLHELHYSKLMVHGDLKPENVIVLQSHDDQQQQHIEVEIIDYGIAKSIRNLSSDTKYLKSSGHFGTKGYVAPELMNHSRYNRKIDVFSAGVVLYNMVTECCLFPKGHKYYEMSASDYYRYLRKKFKCIAKKRKMLVDILYSCLTFDADERLDVKTLIQRYFHSRIR